MGYKLILEPLTPKGYDSVLRSTRRINIWDGSVRSTKTVNSIVRWIEYCRSGPPGNLVICGKTERTVKRNILDPIEEILPSYQFKYLRGVGEATIGGRTCFIIGANDDRSEDKIRGLTLAGGYADEITLLPQSFLNMLDTRLSVTGAKLFGTTNPGPPRHWFKVGYLDRESELDMISFHFTLDDNPYVSDEYKNALKNNFTGLFKKRMIDGLWVAAEGAIYDMFRDDINVGVAKEKYNYYAFSIDHGTTNPFVCGCYGWDYDYGVMSNMSDEKICMKGEYVYDSKVERKQKTDSQYADDVEDFIWEQTMNEKVPEEWIKLKRKQNPNLEFFPFSEKVQETLVKNGRFPEVIYCDPSASSFITEFGNRGWPIIKANNDVYDGIQFVSNLLKDGKFMITEDCKCARAEFDTYSWDMKAQERGEDKPNKTDDHSLDQARYLLFSHFGNYSSTIGRNPVSAEKKKRKAPKMVKGLRIEY